MKPQKSPQDQPSSFQLFQSRLENLINPDHPLVHLAHLIQWTRFDEAYAPPFYCEDNGAPGLPTRLMVGLQYLKYTYNLSDEELIKGNTTCFVTPNGFLRDDYLYFLFYLCCEFLGKKSKNFPKFCKNFDLPP
jgi:hypothetical protein